MLYSRKSKQISARNYIFTTFISILFSGAIFLGCCFIFSNLKGDIYTDIITKSYELYNYKDYVKGITDDTYVLSNNDQTNDKYNILVKTELGAKSISLTSTEFDTVVVNAIKIDKPSYIIYERKYKNIYTVKKFKQRLIVIPYGTLKIN
jgi:hypothetical protein